MVRVSTSAATDYLQVDGTETVTLSDGTNSISVEYANRGQLTARDQLSGMDPGATWFLMPVAEVTGTITAPAAGYTITDASNNVFVIATVQKMVISQMWQVLCRVGVS